MPASVDTPSETLSAMPPADGDAPVQVRLLVDMHRAIARRLLLEGHKARAFTELVRATREVPMSAALASTLTRFALEAGTTGPAALLLSQGVDEAEGRERRAVLHALARLHRRTGADGKAREVLAQVLAEFPNDRRARRVLNVLLERDRRWEELDASLEKETRAHLKDGALRRASRASLARARLWAERHRDFSRAALRYGQAAQYAEEAGDLESAFLLRMVWLRTLHRSGANPMTLRDATVLTRSVAGRIGRSERVDLLLHELGMPTERTMDLDEDEAAELVDPTPRSGESLETGANPVPPPRRRRSTQLELMAVAAAVEPNTRGPEVRAVLAAAAQEGPGKEATARLEAQYIAAGAWRQLAELYREAAAGAGVASERAGWLEKLAVLQENELRSPGDAAVTWGEVAAAVPSPRALQERARVLAAAQGVRGVQTSLEQALAMAQDPETRAKWLVLRGEDRLARRELGSASMDFEAALALVPMHAGACAGLAEIGAQQEDLRPVERLIEALSAMPPKAPLRGELYRRLARLADAPLGDTALATLGWNEVLAEHPADDEALGRLVALARTDDDASNLERVLRTALKAAPRSPRARFVRMELVALLETGARHDEVIEVLRQAVRADANHADAWQALGERLLRAGQTEEALASLERAAETTSDVGMKASRLRRVGRLVADLIDDDERAELLVMRARQLEAQPQKLKPLGPLIPIAQLKPRQPPPRRDDFDAVADALGARLEEESKSGPRPARRPEDVAKGLDVPLPPSARARGVKLPGPASRLPEAELPEEFANLGSSLSAETDAAAEEVSDQRRAKEPTDPDDAPLNPPRHTTEGALSALYGMDESAEVSPARPDVVALDDVEAEDDAFDEEETADRPAVTAPPPPPPPPPALAARPPPLPHESIEELSDDDVSVLEVFSHEVSEISERSEPTDPPDAPPRRPVPLGNATQPSATAKVQREGTQELEVPLEESVPVSRGLDRRLDAEKDVLLAQVRERPLEADGYRVLADHYDTVSDPTRSALMLEIARALEGDPNAAPKAPRLILSAADRAALKHPLLRTEGGELLAVAAPAMARLFPPPELPDEAYGEELRLDAGKGAQGVADALLAAVRILGIRAPDVLVSDEPGPPFSVAYAKSPKLLVTRQVVKKEIGEAELRFYAARALFTLTPELLVLRTLRREQIVHGVALLATPGKILPPEAAPAREAVSSRSWDRLRQLAAKVAHALDVAQLSEGARHSANRAGLVVAGGIAPAIAALRAKRALPLEVSELIRFAMSDKYLELKERGVRPGAPKR